MTIDMEKVRERMAELIDKVIFDTVNHISSPIGEYEDQILDTPITEERVCGECEGEGEVLSPGVRPRAEEDYAYFEKIKCPTCNGTGKLPRLTIRDAIERCRE